ncbi:MAG TPA: hypothetical protein PKY59_10960, partial [Pyrinomonadaceae bacterium]|nr:hypothetical protein [Pyrinomonadaceae bacterium]
MKAGLKSLRIFLIAIFLLLATSNGQNTDIHKRDDLTNLTEEQRNLLRETARFFKEINDKRLSDILCINGQIKSEYQLPSINPCVTDNNSEGFAKTFSSEKDRIENDKAKEEKAKKELEDKENDEINKREDEAKSEINKIRKSERKSIFKDKKSVNISTDEIKETADEMAETERENTNKKVKLIRKNYRNEIEPIKNKIVSLFNEEKTLNVNAVILFETNPNIKFRNEEKVEIRKITEEIKTEISKDKIAETKEIFLKLSPSTSEKFIAEVEETFEDIASQASDSVQIVNLFEIIAEEKPIKIEINIKPENREVTIKYRKCGAGETYSP